MRHLSEFTKGSRWDKGRRSTVLAQFEGLIAVVSRVIGAFARAFLVVLLVATPALLLPGVDTDTAQIVTLVAMLAAIITFVEYVSIYPSLVEFRNAPPFNRVRFVSLFLNIVLMAIVFRGLTDPTTLTKFVSSVGLLVGHVIDFPYSPVRLMILLLPDASNAEHVNVMRAAAGISYLTSLVMLAVFLIVLRLNRWPNRSQQFNFWTNLPTFDPTMGGDVVTRLNRDARFNITLGFFLPFMVPAVAKSASGLFDASVMESPQGLIWMIALWAFLPASLFMRGIAMNRIADMIEEHRTRGARAVRAGLQSA